MSFAVAFTVPGEPVPKQSFRVVKEGGKVGGYRDPRVTAWQWAVKAAALEAMGTRLPYDGRLSVSLFFHLSNYRRVDLDNLSKGVLDGASGAIYKDDKQVWELHLFRSLDRHHPRVEVIVEELTGL
jgi:Holliday junction resolvase RusA-like endonuclease